MTEQTKDYEELDAIKSYLNKLDDLELLTKDEEVQICRAIEVGEAKLLKVCIKSPIILTQILKLKGRLEKSEFQICDMVRTLDKESEPGRVCIAALNLKMLLDDIEEYMDTKDRELGKQIVDELIITCFSSKIISEFIQPVKALYSQMLKHKSTLHDTFKLISESSKEGDTDRISYYIREQETILNELDDLGLETEKKMNDLEKIYKIVTKAETTSSLAKNKLIKGNLRLVVSRAKKHMNRGMEFEDLIQEGNIGLIKAVDRFEYRKGNKFSTYATWWIEQTLGRAIADQSRTIRVPVHMVETINKIARAKNRMFGALGRDPTEEELAQELDIDVVKVKKAMEVSKDPVSFESPVSLNSSGETTYLREALTDLNQESPYQAVIRNVLIDKVRFILATLPPRDEKILRLRFGIGETSNHTLEEIGDRFNVSKERIRQLQAKAIKKFKNQDLLKTLFSEY